MNGPWTMDHGWTLDHGWANHGTHGIHGIHGILGIHGLQDAKMPGKYIKKMGCRKKAGQILYFLKRNTLPRAKRAAKYFSNFHFHFQFHFRKGYLTEDLELGIFSLFSISPGPLHAQKTYRLASRCWHPSLPEPTWTPIPGPTELSARAQRCWLAG